MSTSASSEALDHPRAIEVAVDADAVRVTVADGRQISVPVVWFDWLARATEAERRDFSIVGGGAGIWWERLDDGISVPRLFGLPEDL